MHPFTRSPYVFVQQQNLDMSCMTPACCVWSAFCYSCKASDCSVMTRISGLLCGRVYEHLCWACLQSSLLDFQAIAIALASCWAPALPQLNHHKPPPGASHVASWALLAAMAMCLQLNQTMNMLFLCLQPWFPGGNGTAHLVSCFAFESRIFAIHCVITRSSVLHWPVSYARSCPEQEVCMVQPSLLRPCHLHLHSAYCKHILGFIVPKA